MDWTEATIAAVTWNTLMVSLGGMGLYSAMLVRGSVARTSANFYLVPGTVAVLAWVLLGERPSAARDRGAARGISWMLAGEYSPCDADRGRAPIGAIQLTAADGSRAPPEPFPEHHFGIHHLGKTGLVDLHGRDDRGRPGLGLAMAHAVVGILERQADERFKAG